MKKILFCGLFVALLSACSEQQDVLSDAVVEAPQAEAVENPYAISVDDALAYLSEFLKDEGFGQSRSADRIASVETIKFNRCASRAEQDSLKCDNLLYIANFSDDKGYAILAADQRISEPVIAIADSGCLRADLVYSALDEAEERPIFKDYPLTGPGFFTTPETGDALFMNPNTVDLYDEEHDDYLIGDFEVDDEEEENSIVQKTPTELKRTAELAPTTLTVEYAKRQVSANNGRVNLAVPNPHDDDNISGSVANRTEVKYGAWTITTVGPLLNQYTNWHQRTPFNDLYPNVRHFPLLWKKKRASAGCFPLAIAKVMQYFKCPADFQHRGYKIDWEALEYTIDEWELSAAHLLKKISSECNSLYFYGGTFTWPWEAVDFLKSIGIPAKDKDYDFKKITEMINSSKPVIIYGIPGINITRAHCWNIDGFRVKTRTNTIQEYINNELVDTRTTQETIKMVHCVFNYKWGNHNGYYISGVFDTTDNRTEIDYYNVGTPLKYNTLVRVLLY